MYFEPLKTLNEEERRLARALAREFDRITLLVADDSHTRIPSHTVGARVSSALCPLDDARRSQIVERARKALARDRKDGDDDTGAKHRSPFDIDPNLIVQLRQQLRKRWDAHRATIPGLLRTHLNQEVQATHALRTTLDMQLSSETSSTQWFRDIQIAGPETLDFRWNTHEAGAARGYWQLTGPITGNSQGSIIATGLVPDNPSALGIGGYFTIPLGPHLPPTPPQSGVEYHVRVLPLGPAARFAVVTPNGVPVGAGGWSNAAIIRYGKEFAQPGQTFDISEVYRKAHFHVDWMRMVEDQTGPGNEEFHLSGFVHHEPTEGSKQQVKFGPYFKSIDPDDRSEHAFGRQATFHLNNPDTAQWPRLFVAVISIMEEDDGGGLADWQAAIDEIASDAMHGSIAHDIDAFLDELREDIEDARDAYTAAMVSQALAVISAGISGTLSSFIAAWATAVVAWAAATISLGAIDDFYGTEIYLLSLFTNEVEIVADEAAGTTTGSNIVSGGDFAGAMQPDGSFRLDQTVIRFYGLGGPEDGSPLNGIVEVGVHWEFSRRELV